jgi:tetraacyldisaccharide-1-P 4'-kinase
MGGTGKTPVVIDLVMRLLEMGKKPIVVSRGYGGSHKGPVMVSPKHTADDVGDEPILLTGVLPVPPILIFPTQITGTLIFWCAPRYKRSLAIVL